MKECDADHADPDVATMLAFQAGDEEAFVNLYRRYRDKIFNFARRLLGDVATAEEAAQDVFLKVYAAKKSYQPKSRFSTYIFRIASNHCFNLLGRRERKVVDRSKEIDAQSGTDSPEAGADRTRLRAALTSALSALPDKQAAALVLCLHEGMSYQEVAAVLEVTTSSVKSLVFRARENMMQQLAEHLTDAGEVKHAVQ